LNSDFDRLEIIQLKAGLLEPLLHNFLDFHLFDLVFFLKVLNVGKFHFLNEMEAFRNKILQSLKFFGLNSDLSFLFLFTYFVMLGEFFCVNGLLF
jgi:hypothetical protein